MDELMTPTHTPSELLLLGDVRAVSDWIESLTPSETARAISRLSEVERHLLFNLLSPEDAAEIIEEISDTQAADLVEEMPLEQAAAIIEEMTSDHQADLLSEMDGDTSQAILSMMHRRETKEARM